MDNLKRQLKELSAIEPDRGFMARSRASILSEKRSTPFGIFVFPSFSGNRITLLAGGGVFVAAVLALFVFAHPFSPGPTTAISSLGDTQTLTQELNDLNVNIQLEDISYQTTANQAITAAIAEISDTKTKHLNADKLQSEQKSAEPSQNTNPEIDQLLNKIIL